MRNEEECVDEPNVDNEPKIKKKNCQQFRDEYTRLDLFLIAAGRSGYARCTLCNCNFSIEHFGRSDCAKHINSKKHENCKKGKANNEGLLRL